MDRRGEDKFDPHARAAMVNLGLAHYEIYLAFRRSATEHTNPRAPRRAQSGLSAAPRYAGFSI